MADIKGRKVLRFRCIVDPMIGPKPRNAFDRGPKGDLKNWMFELTPAGVYVKTNLVIPGQAKAQVEEHVVPFTNIQSIKLFPPGEAPEDKEAEELEKKNAGK